MTKRQEAFYWCVLAYAFAMNGTYYGYKGYRRSQTLILRVMDTLCAKLTQKQIDKAIELATKKVEEKEIVTAYDFMDYISNAMEIIKQGKERKLNSLLALAATNIQEELG